MFVEYEINHFAIALKIISPLRNSLNPLSTFTHKPQRCIREPPHCAELQDNRAVQGTQHLPKPGQVCIVLCVSVYMSIVATDCLIYLFCVKCLCSVTYRNLRSSIIDLVLATDMAKHFEHLAKFNMYSVSIAI